MFSYGSKEKFYKVTINMMCFHHIALTLDLVFSLFVLFCFKSADYKYGLISLTGWPVI